MRTLILIANLALTLSSFAQVPTNGLVGFWPFNGNANDATGNGNNGVVYGATIVPDRFGNPAAAFNFNGSSDKILINSPNTYLLFNPLIDSYSIVFWVKSSDPCIDPVGSRIMEYVDGLNTTGYPFSFQINPTDNSMRGYLYDGANTSYVLYDNVFDGNWKMITYVIDNQNDSLFGYINNVLYQSSQNTLTNSFEPDTLIVIGNRFSNDRPFAGFIDDIRIYNRALTGAEISLLFNEPPSGINPVSCQGLIRVYPNPTNNHMIIDYGDNATYIGCIIKITNSLGQLVYSNIIDQQQSIIDLNNWPRNGVYYLHLIDAHNNTIYIQKVVLQ
ncbi:MAG TPA: T9SS type A sorting domain-containing protein [Bacteroidales bacterium]|nr:T9SS type A sorting domain-containing protein [Bacteroidales bacterium]HSA43745.1 T9SS type A sorting domain-containing protein [Bacteroidales bacterium]